MFVDGLAVGFIKTAKLLQNSKKQFASRQKRFPPHWSQGVQDLIKVPKVFKESYFLKTLPTCIFILQI